MLSVGTLRNDAAKIHKIWDMQAKAEKKIHSRIFTFRAEAKAQEGNRLKPVGVGK